MTDEGKLLRELVAYDTHNPGGDEVALATRLAEELKARGADEVELVEVPRTVGASELTGAYVFARWGTPRWLLNAHLDTVPPNTGWTGDPYQARTVDDRIIGLGACDTKGAIACALTALTDARPDGVAVLFSGDEERGSSCMRHFLAHGRASGIERALVCEPTSLKGGRRHRGVLCLEARLRGQGGHSSRADDMPAPVGELSLLAAACHQLGVKRRTDGPEGFRGLCMNVAQLEGGIAFNVVPDEARLLVSVRPPPGGDVELLRAELTALAHAATPGAEVRFPIDHAPFQTREPAGFLPLLGDVQAVDLAFWTEAALLSQAGIDALVYGPGDIANAHAPDESVALEELAAARQAFATAFSRRSNGHG